MANRSLLFACTSLPGADSAVEVPAAVGLSEWSYAIPLVPRILVSADTCRCRSLIWPDEDDVALAGRFAEGLDRLERFLRRIEHPAIGPFREPALDFLGSKARGARYVVLECAEVLAMNDAPLSAQTAQLLTDLRGLDAELNRPNRKTFWQRVLKPSQQSIEEPLRALGLGYWSDTLYFAPSGPGDDEDAD